jgi:hypothetical protein
MRSLRVARNVRTCSDESAVTSRVILPRVALRFVVVVDTNVAHSSRVDEPLAKDLRDAVADMPKGVEVRWAIPELARLEREHAMVTQAQKTLPAARALASLAGQSFATKENDLEGLCRDSLNRELSAARIEVLPLAPKEVDLEEVIRDAVYRRPPFREGKEAGFRDRMILETLDQFLRRDKLRDAVVVFVTKDEPFASAARRHYSPDGRVRVVTDLQGARELIEASAADIQPRYVEQLKESARALHENPASELHVSRLVGRLEREHAAALVRAFENTTERVFDGSHLEDIWFAGPESDRLTFVSRIRFRYNVAFCPPNLALTTPLEMGPGGFSSESPLPLRVQMPEFAPIGHGWVDLICDVRWSARGGKDASLSDVKVTSIEFVEARLLWQ